MRYKAKSVNRFAGSVNQWLKDRDYAPLYHLICVLVLGAAAGFIFYRYIGHPHGTMMATDMTWPDLLSRLQFKVTNTWTPYGSGPLTIDPMFLFWIYPSSMAARVLHIPAPTYMFLMYFATFWAAGASMYALAVHTIRRIRREKAAGYAVYVGATLAALVYMYNPWSITYLKPYLAYPIYAFLPLVFLAMTRTFDSPSIRNIVLFSLFVVMVNTTYQLTWLWGLIFSYAIFLLLFSSGRRDALRRVVKVVPVTMLLFFLLNAHWIFPYLGARISGKPYLPFYGPELSGAMVSGLSGNNYLANNFRLLSVWTWSIDQLKGHPVLPALSYAIPVFALLGLVLGFRLIRKNRTVAYWTLVAALALLLTTGAGFILRRPYLYLTFDAPGSNIYGWLLRTSERWAFFLPLFFSLMLGLLVFMLLDRHPQPSGSRRWLGSLLQPWREHDTSEEPGGSKRTGDDLARELEATLSLSRFYRKTAFAVVVIALVLTSMFPRALHVAQTEFSPVVVPGDYARLKEFLEKKIEPRVVWLPFIGAWSFTHSWSNGRPVDMYGPANSVENLFSNYEIMNRNSYFNWLQDLYLKDKFFDVGLDRSREPEKEMLTRLLTPFAARYFIFDSSIKGYDFGPEPWSNTELEKIFETNLLKLYEAPGQPPYVRGATSTVNANSFSDNRAFNQKFVNDELRAVAFSDGKPYFGDAAPVPRKYGGIDLNDYLETVNRNPGFEDAGGNGSVPYWDLESSGAPAEVSLDQAEKVEGRNSLKIVNRSSAEFSLSYVENEPFWVIPHNIYAIETSIKYRNASWSLMTVQGFKPETSEWVNIAFCPTVRDGNSDWKTHYFSFYVPPDVTTLRAHLAGGWAKDPAKGPAVTWFDKVRVSRVRDEVYEQILRTDTPPDITFNKLSPEKIEVQVKNAKNPFVLVLSEQYDNKWVARLPDGSESDSVPLYSTINGFPIGRTGDYKLVLEYRPQAWFLMGLKVSLGAGFLCLLYLLYDWKLREMRLPGRAAAALRGRRARRRDERAAQPGRARPMGALGRAVSWLRSVIEQPPRRGHRKS